MISLPAIDYSPLAKKNLPIQAVRRELRIKNPWLFDSSYKDHLPLRSLGDEETEHAAHLYQFALENNFGFIGNLSGILPFPRSYFHSLATLNYPPMLTYGIIMKLENGWLEIGQIRLGTAPQQRLGSDYFTYIKVTLPQHLPDLTIDSRNEGLPTHSIGKTEYVTESSEFNQHFKLYFGKNHEQEGLKILSPDVMSILIDHFSRYDIEMRDHTISFITRNYDLTDPDTLKDILDVTAMLIGELSYQVRNPASPGAVPQDMASYKALHRYAREPDEVIQTKAHKETLKVFLYSVVIAFFLFAITFLLALL